jgi:hypothetical protein
MARGFTFKKDKNWKKFEKMLQPEQMKNIDEHLRRANRLSGKVIEAKIRDKIKEGKFEANKPLTVFIKGDNKPLVGVETGAHLFGSITSKEIDPKTVFIGVLRTNNFYNIALKLHEGVEIKVTDKMRGLFFVLWKASEGELDRSQLSQRAQDLFDYTKGRKGWKPLKPGTTKIIIPPRPFIDVTIEDDEVREIVRRNWVTALRIGFAEVKAMS